MPTANIPSPAQALTDSNGNVTPVWFTYLQSLQNTILGINPSNLNLTGILNVNTTLVSTIGSGTDDLIIYTMPGGTLVNDGDFLEIQGWGSFADNPNLKTVSINFGSQVIYTTDSTTTLSDTWSFTAKIIRVNSERQDVVVEFISTIDAPISFRSEANQDPTGNIVIKCTAAGLADADVTQYAMITMLTPNT